MSFKGKVKWTRIRGTMAPDRFLYLEKDGGGFNPRSWRWACLMIGTPNSILDQAHLLRMWAIYLEKQLIYGRLENEAIASMGFAEFWWLVEYGPAILEE